MLKVIATSLSITTILTSVLLFSFILSQTVVGGVITLTAAALASFKWLFVGLFLFFMSIGMLALRSEEK
jgi:hypothetical protein